MADWASAIAQGVGAAANSGAQSIGDQIKIGQQMDAEKVAADLKVDTAQRLAAADEMMKNRAAERYSAVVKQQMATPAPVAPQTVQQTGLTSDSAEGADLTMGGITGSMDKVNGILKMAQGTLANPRATAQQKADAQGVIDQISKQVDAQKESNADDVDGQTRPRTLEEATDAANAQTLQNDPAAYIAGTKMVNDANKDDMAQKRLDQQAALAREAGARQERIADQRTAQQDRAADDRYNALMTKIEAGQNGSGGAAPAEAKMIEYLVNQGMDRKIATDRVLGTGAGATKDPVALAAQLASGLISAGSVRVSKDDPPGTTVASKAMDMATAQIQGAQQKLGAGAAPTSWSDAVKGGVTVPNPLDNSTASKRPPLSSFQR